jgi:SAM-dependent methyltransferase
MASVTHGFMKLFRGISPASGEGAVTSSAQRVTRRSSGLGELARVLKSEEPLCALDLGSTSPTNIRYLTEKGHKVYSEDLLTASTDPALAVKDENGKIVVDGKRFLEENLIYPPAQFDVILCWNLADYLDESLVKPVIGRLWSVMKPGGVLLAFFHTKEAGPDAPCYRFHITGNETLEMQPIGPRHGLRGVHGHAATFRLQRVFNNRHIENLFRDFASIKFFLARDNVREVLVVR